VNAEKAKCMARFRNQNARRSQNIKMDSFVWVRYIKYLGKNLTNQNFIQEEIESRLKSGNSFLSFDAKS
jgi:hypothetical protein